MQQLPVWDLFIYKFMKFISFTKLLNTGAKREGDLYLEAPVQWFAQGDLFKRWLWEFRWVSLHLTIQHTVATYNHRSPDCKKLGHGVPKLVSLFVSHTNLIDEANKNLLTESNKNAEDLFEGLTEDEAKRRKQR